jgi:hypothetical protein
MLSIREISGVFSYNFAIRKKLRIKNDTAIKTGKKISGVVPNRFSPHGI